MKRSNLSKLLTATALIVVFYSCKKNNETKPAESLQTELATAADIKHVYGLLPTTADQYNAVPKFSLDDFKSKNTTLSTIFYPPVLTLSNPAVRNQGNQGSCTAFCGTTAYEIMYYYKNRNYPAVLSPAFLYYEERVNILGEKIAADKGASMINIDQALAKYGVCTETLYTYPPSAASAAYNTPPAMAAVSNALSYKISSYKLINTGDTIAVKTCLRHGIPVMFGFNVYDSRSSSYFEGLNTQSYTYNPLTPTGALATGLSLLGGHANVIIGYDDIKKAFKVQNSWGTLWGLNGFYYLPYTVFSSTKIVPQGSVYYAII